MLRSQPLGVIQLLSRFSRGMHEDEVETIYATLEDEISVRGEASEAHISTAV